MDRRWIVDRVGAETFDRLANELAGSELGSVLLEVMQQRAGSRTMPELLAQYERDSFVRPAGIDLRTSNAIDADFLEAAAAFEAIELSPVTPLGTCSVVALTDQNRVLSALRNAEVTSDPTNVLALESALRLRKEASRAVHLATSQRVIRAQPNPKLPGFSQHFRIFVLTSAGTETKDHAFTVDTLVQHVRTMLGALDRLETHGYSFGRRRIDILATAQRAALGDRIAGALGELAARKPLEHAYYSSGLRYMLWVTAPNGDEIPLVDGGAFDWLAKLGSNRRAVFVASGAGAQLVALRFAKPG